MKIAILGSAPSSLGLAPIGNPAWKIWGCSPGVYAAARRCDAWFELHRWEPPTIGVPESQKQWFSPEYVAWMAQRDPMNCPVWMKAPVPEIPASRALPIDDLVGKYGSYFFTSSISIMLACAIDNILEARGLVKSAASDVSRFVGNTGGDEEDEIGLWGVDMAATDEYGYQRAGCQYFLLLAADLGIKIYVPPESDLLRPMPIYGLCESEWWHIKNTARQRELQGRLAQANAQAASVNNAIQFLTGALDDLNYQLQTWGENRDGMGPSPTIVAHSPMLREEILAANKPVTDAALEAANARVAEANAQLADANAKIKKGEKAKAALQRMPKELRKALLAGESIVPARMRKAAKRKR